MGFNVCYFDFDFSTFYYYLGGSLFIGGNLILLHVKGDNNVLDFVGYDELISRLRSDFLSPI